MAVKLAADHPDIVGRIVLVSTPAEENQVDLPTLLWLVTLPIIGPITYALGRLLRPLRRLWMRPFVLDRYDLTDEVIEDAGKSTPAAITKTLNTVRREVARGRLLRQAGAVKVPVLVVTGEEDQIVDPRAADHWARTLLAEIVFMEGCGHLPMLERTGDFNDRILAFLTGDDRYLDDGTEPAEDETREDLDIGENTPEKVYPPMSSESSEPDDTSEHPSDRPTVFRKQGGRYVPRDRGGAEDWSEDRDEPSADSAADRPREPLADEGEDVEERPPKRGGMPEIPKDLFELPEPLEFRPRDLSREEDDRRIREQRGEHAGGEPERPEEGPRS
jgi:hypothetical protein